MAVPRDHMVAILIDLPKATTAGSPSSEAPAVPAWIGELRAAGVFGGAGASAAVLADVITSMAALQDTPFAAVLTDLEVEPAELTSPQRQSLRLARLGAVAIAYTRGQNDKITAQIQRLLTTWTQSDRARVEREEAEGITAYTLIDTDSPRWARLHWAAIGDYYVVAIGDEAFASSWRAIRKDAPALDSDPWIEKHRTAVGLDAAEVAWQIDFRKLHARLDRQDDERTASVLGSLGLGAADRGLWTVGRRGRAIIATSVHVTESGDVVTPIAIEQPADGSIAGAIPAEADAYAVIPCAVGALVKQWRDSYLATRSPEMRELLRSHWGAFAASSGVDLDRDVCRQLGDRIIIHTYPRHPLGISILVTVLFELRASPANAQQTLDRILAQCDRWMTGTEKDGTPRKRGWLTPQLRRGGDGVWNLQVGLAGPAIGVTDGWVVLSFSPLAVRECIAKMTANRPAEQKPVE